MDSASDSALSPQPLGTPMWSSSPTRPQGIPTALLEEGSLLRRAGLPSITAVTLPDWAVQDLLGLLQPDDEAAEAQENCDG